MTKIDSADLHDPSMRPAVQRLLPPAQRDGSSCDLYAPGHQMHYRHQGDAVRSPSQDVRDVLVEGTTVLLTLEDGTLLGWRHHDPARLTRIVDLLSSACVVYRQFHALRVGPYFFNCATEADAWQDCRLVAPGHSDRPGLARPGPDRP